MRRPGFYETGADLTDLEVRQLPPDAFLAYSLALGIISNAPMPPVVVARAVAECRYYRAVLLQAGLDPDKFTPEDALLLATDTDGGLSVASEYRRAHDLYLKVYH